MTFLIMAGFVVLRVVVVVVVVVDVAVVVGGGLVFGANLTRLERCGTEKIIINCCSNFYKSNNDGEDLKIDLVIFYSR